MKAVCIERPEKLVISDRNIPTIERADQVLIKVKCVGICGSDVQIFQGTNPSAVYHHPAL
ncbi:MAG: alcohol dehydrogenase catalytic domain-containing protein [Firmicutes bacterium]|nr:alcohol dehydrogenase catalytic domain-containing protein [Bacillota bacterium]